MPHGVCSCDECRIYQRLRFLSVTVQVRQALDRPTWKAVTCLGSCVWYELFVGLDINACAAWVKEKGGCLGATKVDERGRYREGFVNFYALPEHLRPPRALEYLARHTSLLELMPKEHDR